MLCKYKPVCPSKTKKGRQVNEEEQTGTSQPPNQRLELFHSVVHRGSSAESPAILAHISPVSSHGQPARSFVTGVYLCWEQMRQNSCEEVHKPSWDAAGTR